MKLTIANKALLLTVFCTLGTACMLLGIGVWSGVRLGEEIRQELDRAATVRCESTAQDVRSMLELQHQQYLSDVRSGMKVAEWDVKTHGGFSTGEATVDWEAKNQFTGKTHHTELPQMLLGDQWLGQNQDPARPSTLVDEVGDFIGNGTCTVFQRMNDRGDMLRVCTNVIAQNGQRGVGTYIPAIQADGSPDPVVSAVLQGETYIGRAYVVDSWYLTKYEPVDVHGEIIGAIYVGFKLNQEDQLRHLITRQRMGKLGHVAIWGTHRDHRGRYIIAPNQELDGDINLNTMDADGKPVFKRILELAPKLGPDQSKTVEYNWKCSPDVEPQRALTSVAYFEPWDWTIMATAYEEDFEAAHRRMSSAFRSALFVCILGTGLFFGVIAFLVHHGSRRIAKPLLAATQRMRALKGDFASPSLRRISVDSNDEVGELVSAFNELLDELAQAITEKVRTLSRAVEQSPASVVITKPDASITYVNPSFEKKTGYTAAEAIGKTPSILKADVHSPQFYAEMWKTLTSGEVWRGEICNRHKNGSLIWEDTSIAPVFNEDGKTTSYVAVKVDITEKKQTEESLRAAIETAEEASKAKSQFLATMSHELRTPLNGVIGMSELLAGTHLDAKQRQFVDACRSSGKTLLGLINDILDFSKIEAGKVELDFHDFDLETLVTETVDSLARPAFDKGLEMSCRIDAECLLILNGDGGRVRQMLTNLLSNALKFTESGEISVGTRLVASEGNRTRVRFEVRDTGIGIPADRRCRLFQPFAQADATTTRRFGGTGLGLSISQSFVELMGGKIGVESEEGVGSTFWFEVPFELIGKNPCKMHDLGELAGRRVLIVDDNETNRTILAEYTAEWGLINAEAASVDEALNQIEQAEASGNPFHLVLTDFHMPGRDGLELARSLKGVGHLPIVLVSSSGSAELASDNLDAIGIQWMLSKPAQRREVYDAIRHVLLGGNKSRNEGIELSDAKPDEKLAGHVLLAEDNHINQMYMSELLKQVSCTFDVAANGNEAVEAVQRVKFNLVLMDCQMPGMDGFEATRRIRQMESEGLLDGSLPVIALTANAIKGDRERCLAAGMDEYLSKPVQLDQVKTMLKRFLANEQPGCQLDSRTSDASTDPTLETAVPPPPAIDAELFLGRCFGNLDFASSLLDELESTGLERVEEIRRQVLQNDATRTAEAAHALKGAAGILCAGAVQSLAAEIEQAGRSSNIESVETMLNDLTTEMQRCLDHVPKLRKEMKLAKGGHADESISS